MAYIKVIIVGGGFGGINVAKALNSKDLDVLLIDRANYHLFQPLLYQVATAALSAENIASSFREILRKNKNTTVIMGNVVSIDKDKEFLTLDDGDVYFFDYLILAPGASHSYFGRDEWKPFAPGLKTVEDAMDIRNKILIAFEHAEVQDSLKESQKYLRFVIVGGGPTGVEMAGAIAEIAHQSLFENFRRIKPEQAKIYLIEGEGQILPSYPRELADHAKKDLEKMGVKVLLNSKVTDVTKDGVYMGDKFIETPTVIWAAGNQASPLLKTLDVKLDKQGRALVEKDLSLPGYPNIFVIGDAAHFENNKGEVLPGIAPVAIQEGRYLAKMIEKQIPFEKRKPFVYFDKGTLATIGKYKAVGLFRNFYLSGFLAWWFWGIIHIFYLISFPNRLLVLIQWFFYYVTGERQSRLIVGENKGEKKDDKER